jgi:hypothetical protein
MRYVLKADGRFVQSSDDLTRIKCKINHFVTWWEAMAYKDPPNQLSVVDTTTDLEVASSVFRPNQRLCWKVPKT